MSEHLSVSSADKAMVKEISRIDEILKFCEKYDRSFVDVKVKELRHIVPLMLMEAYSNIYGLYSRKVKGIWEKKPDDWPAHIPFVDPNNKLKQSNGGKSGVSNSKPAKSVCLDMLVYLHGMLLKQKKVCLSLAAQEKAPTSQASTMSDIKPANVQSWIESFNLLEYVNNETVDIDSLSGMTKLGITLPRDGHSITVDLAASRINCMQQYQGQCYENTDQAQQVFVQPGGSVQSYDEPTCNSLQEPSCLKVLQRSSADSYMQCSTLDPVLNATASDNDVPYQNGSISRTTGFDSKIQTNSYMTANQSLLNQSQMFQSINTSATNDEACCSNIPTYQTSHSSMTIQTTAATNAFHSNGAFRDSFITCDQKEAPMQMDTCSAADDEFLPQTVVDCSAIFDMMGKLKTLTNLSDSQVNALCPEDKKQLRSLFEMYVDIRPAVELRLKQIQPLMGNSVAQSTVYSHGSGFSMEYTQNVDYPKPVQSSNCQNSTAGATSVLQMNDTTSGKCNMSNNCGVANPMQINKVIKQKQICDVAHPGHTFAATTTGQVQIAGQSVDSVDLNIKTRDGVNANANDVLNSIKISGKISLDSNLSEPDFYSKFLEEKVNSQVMPAKSDMKNAEMNAKLEERVVALEEDNQHIKASRIGSIDSQIALGSHGSGVDSNYFSGELDSSMSSTSGSSPSLCSYPSIDHTANRDIILHEGEPYWRRTDSKWYTLSGYVSNVSASGAAARSSSSQVEYCGNKVINGNPNIQSHAIVSFSESNHMIGGSADTSFHFAGSNSQSRMMSTPSNQSFITPASSTSRKFLIKQPQQFLLQSNDVIARDKGQVLSPTSIALGVSEPKVSTPMNAMASSTLIPGYRVCKVGDKRRYMDVQENEQKEAVNTHNTVLTFGPIPMCVENFDFEDYDVQPSKRQRD